jgi:hypothetical protein
MKYIYPVAPNENTIVDRRELWFKTSMFPS